MVADGAVTPPAPFSAVGRASVADGYRRSGRFDEAEKLYRRAMEVFEEPEHQDYDALLLAKSGLVRVFMATGRYEEARLLVRELRQFMYGLYRPLSMSDCYRLEAEMDAVLERFSSAVVLQEQALQLRVKHLGRDHVDTAAALRELGIYLLGAGRHREALTACTRARDILAETLGDDSPQARVWARRWRRRS